MIPPDCGPGAFYKIMDAVAIDARSHRIEGTDYIEYSIPRSSKVKYTPPSPTTSGYSESGSEMDNHDSGRASELEGSPKVPPKRPDKISFGLDLFERIGSSATTANDFARIKTEVTTTGHINRVLEPPAGVVTVEASTLNSLMYSLENTRSRLDQMERNMEALIKAITLQNKVSNEAVFKLTRTLLALGSDVKHFRGTHDVGQPATSQPPHSTNMLSNFDSSQSCTGPQPRKFSLKSNSESATYPRLLHSAPMPMPLSVAPPSGLHIEMYDNVPYDNNVEELSLSASNHNDVTIGASDNDNCDVIPKPPLYAKVRKVKSVESGLSEIGSAGSRPPTLPRRSTELLASMKDDGILGVEKLLSDLQLPTESSKQGDDYSGAESLTRISRFSDVESLMSAFDNEENNSFSEDEFDTDESSENDFDNFDSRRKETTAISPDQGISSAADLSQSIGTHCTTSTNEIIQSSPTLLEKNAEEYSSSIIIPSKSSTSIYESEKEGSQKWLTKMSPSHGRKANALFANYKKIFKRKKKRAESQTSFTFVNSPLYEKELQQNPSKPNKKLKKGLSVDNIISSKKLSASNLSLVSSNREDDANIRTSNPKLHISPCKGSPRSLTHQSRANAQLLRLQSRETIPDEDSTPEHVLVVTENAEFYDNFAAGEHFDETSNIAEYNVQRIPNGNIYHETYDNSEPMSHSSSLSKLVALSRDGTFEDDISNPRGVILDQLQREQADRIRFEQDEPPPKPTRPGYPKDGQRSGSQHANGGVPGYRGMPVVPPKQKVFTPEELANHEAQEKLRQKQLEDKLIQQRLTQQQKEAEENEKWLQQEEINLNPDATNGRRPAGSSGSLSDLAPPPPSVAPSKPPRKLSKPRDETPHGPPQTKLEEVKTAPTMQLNRDNDEVYKNTMEVVKAVLGMNSMAMEAKAEDLFNSVKTVGGALKQLCACLEKVLPELPEDFHREIDMAQRTTNKDLSQVINQLKLVQRFYATTQVVEYKKCLMAANQVLALDAKNLLDVVDRARIRKIQTAQEKEKAQASDVRRGSRDDNLAIAHEPEDVYPDEDFL